VHNHATQTWFKVHIADHKCVPVKMQQWQNVVLQVGTAVVLYRSQDDILHHAIRSDEKLAPGNIVTTHRKLKLWADCANTSQIRTHISSPLPSLHSITRTGNSLRKSFSQNATKSGFHPSLLSLAWDSKEGRTKTCRASSPFQIQSLRHTVFHTTQCNKDGPQLDGVRRTQSETRTKTATAKWHVSRR
jgi:hypothetical protein